MQGGYKVKIFLISGLSLVVFSYTATGQVLTVEHQTEDNLVTSISYNRLLSCNGTGQSVGDKPDFKSQELDAYVSAFGSLIFVNKKDEPIFCMEMVDGWGKSGFIDGQSKELNKQLLLFKLSGASEEIYIDPNREDILYRISDNSEPLVVSQKPKEEPGKKIEVVNQYTGRDSKIMQNYCYRIVTKEKWETVWKEHSQEAVPDIEFDKNMVIAIFYGQTINRNGLNVVEIREIDNVIRFRYQITGFQSGAGGVLTVPFGIVIIPKSDKVVRLEVNTQGYIGGPATWSHVGELASGDTVIEGPKIEIVTEEEHKRNAQEMEKRLRGF